MTTDREFCAALQRYAREVKAGRAVERDPFAGREFSSTQVDLAPVLAAAVRRLAAGIPDADLAEGGREPDPHITVKYGIHTSDPDAVRRIFGSEKPARFTLGKTSVFRCPEYDVVKVDVDSPDLRRLNAKVAAATPCTDTHPEYLPHVTLAYVQPGLGKKYAGESALTGKTGTAGAVTFSGKDGKNALLPLGLSVGEMLAELTAWKNPAARASVEAARARPLRGNVTTPEARLVGDRMGVDWRGVNLEQFRMGLEDEQEHQDVTGGDPILTGRIVLAHLKEKRDYYTRLKAVEKAVPLDATILRQLLDRGAGRPDAIAPGLLAPMRRACARYGVQEPAWLAGRYGGIVEPNAMSKGGFDPNEPRDERGEWARGATAKAAKGMPKLDSVADLMEKVSWARAQGSKLYVRWSNPVRDATGGFISTDHGSGKSEGGLSVNGLDATGTGYDNDPVGYAAMQALEYRFIGMGTPDPGVRCWVLLGTHARRGADNETVLDPETVRPVAVLSDRLLKDLLTHDPTRKDVLPQHIFRSGLPMSLNGIANEAHMIPERAQRAIVSAIRAGWVEEVDGKGMRGEPVKKYRAKSQESPHAD